MSWRTSSEVTRLLPGRTGSKGTPLRVFRSEGVGRKALRASEEITSPTLFPSVAAISFAAAKTSSSMARVVRMACPNGSIKHQSSYIKFAVLNRSANAIPAA
ncbi:MAG: hypothetical protein WBE76_04840 [Terracidiphilus sp.]